MHRTTFALRALHDAGHLGRAPPVGGDIPGQPALLTTVNIQQDLTVDEDRTEVVRRELMLLDPAVRSDSNELRKLLHTDFLEFGASGRTWNVDCIVELLAVDPSAPSQPAMDLKPVTLATDVVLLTYRLEGERSSLRSSVWVRDAGSWQLRFHQGTPTSPLGP